MLPKAYGPLKKKLNNLTKLKIFLLWEILLTKGIDKLQIWRSYSQIH